jgi:hypothetical protein
MSDSIKPLTATDTSKTFRIATPEITVDLELKKIDRQVVDSHSYEMPGLPSDAVAYTLTTNDAGVLKQVLWIESQKTLKLISVPRSRTADAKIYNGSSLEDALLSAYRDKALN